MTEFTILLMVAPLSAGVNYTPAPDTATELALAVVGELRDRGWNVIVHADATVSVAVGLSMLELRPDMPMERGEESRGKVHIVPLFADEEPEWQMLQRREASEGYEDRFESLWDILQSTGLVVWQEGVDNLLARCKAVMTIGSHPDFDKKFHLPLEIPRIFVCDECPEGMHSIKDYLLPKQRGLTLGELEERRGPSPPDVDHISNEEASMHQGRQKTAFSQAQLLVAIDNLLDRLASPEGRGFEGAL